jgi:glycosyltransferase involved in cell wall biosynthesis
MKKSKNNKPLISVVMPVYNAGKFLPEAIESILSQTVEDFEFIIVDDASTDNSWEIIQDNADKDNRIRAFRNEKNLGVSATTNFAINKTQAKYIARMDADDVSFSDRLEKQLEYLKQNNKVVAVGGQCVVINESNQVIGQKRFPVQSKKLKKMIFEAVPIQQPSLMINTSLLPKDFNWYSPQCSSAEEIDVLFKLMEYGQLANLKDWTLYYRYREDSLSHINPKQTFWLTLKSRLKAVKKGFIPTPKAIIMNIAQITVISLLPNKVITELWYLLRGINQPQLNLPGLEKDLKTAPSLS